jgi:putative sigma-54 modulation protein
MHVEITTRHCDIPDHLKERVESRMTKLLRFDDRIKDARVVISLEKNRYSAEATLQANGARLVSHSLDDSDKTAVEIVLDRLEAQLRRHRDRVVRGRKKATAMGEAAGAALPGRAPAEDETVEAFGDDADYEGLVSEDPGDIEVEMDLAEAVAMLKASRRDVLGFTNRDTARPVVLYKRRDGNIGVVDISS